MKDKYAKKTNKKEKAIEYLLNQNLTKEEIKDIINKLEKRYKIIFYCV